MAAARYFYTKTCRESNFYPHAFAYRGVTLPTSEHHLMREKARLMGDHLVVTLIDVAPSALAAKRLGRKVKPWDQGRWDDHCDQIMEDILVAKFKSTPAMRDYILGIEGRFYEASPKDKVWGIGIGVKQAQAGAPHNGQNKLGLALDRARARIEGRFYEASPKEREVQRPKS